MRHKTATLLGAVCVSAIGGSALADDPQRITVQAAVAETYDSNVAESGAAAAAARDISPEDAIFQPQITADVTLPFGRQDVFLKGLLSYDSYARNSVLNSGAINLQGGFDGRFRDCKATLTGDFDDHRTSLQNLNVTVVRNIEETESIRLDGDCGREIGLGPTISVIQQWSGNSAPQLITSDFRSLTATAGIAYRRPSIGELSLVGSYNQTDFPNRGLLIGPASTQDGYRDYSVEMRYNRRLGARLEGSISIGYTVLDPYVASVAGYGGLEYKADLSVRVSSRLQAKVSLAQAPIPTIISNSTYTIEKSYSAEADYAIGPRLSLKLSGSDRSDHYQGAALVSGVDIQRESFVTVSGAAHLQLGRRLAVELQGEHEIRSADVAIYNFTDDRVTLSISAAI